MKQNKCIQYVIWILNFILLYLHIFNLQERPEEAEKFVTNALSNLRTTMNVMEAVQSTDIVIEAVLENINVKHKLFSSIDPVKAFFLYPYIQKANIYYSAIMHTGE
jgi:hypothetical protein